MAGTLLAVDEFELLTTLDDRLLLDPGDDVVVVLLLLMLLLEIVADDVVTTDELVATLEVADTLPKVLDELFECMDELLVGATLVPLELLELLLGIVLVTL